MSCCPNCNLTKLYEIKEHTNTQRTIFENVEKVKTVIIFLTKYQSQFIWEDFFLLTRLAPGQRRRRNIQWPPVSNSFDNVTGFHGLMGLMKYCIQRGVMKSSRMTFPMTHQTI